jgi:peptide chain release factor
MKETWSHHLRVERGNAVRTFSGSDFKKNYVDRSFKNRGMI